MEDLQNAMSVTKIPRYALTCVPEEILLLNSISKQTGMVVYLRDHLKCVSWIDNQKIQFTKAISDKKLTDVVRMVSDIVSKALLRVAGCDIVLISTYEPVKTYLLEYNEKNNISIDCNIVESTEYIKDIFIGAQNYMSMDDYQKTLFGNSNIDLSKMPKKTITTRK